MTKPKVLIVGGNGFVGSNLREYFLAKGWSVFSTTSRSSLRDQEIHFDFLDPKPPKIIESFDLVVYCSYVLQWTGEDPNLQALKILRQDVLKSAKKHLFISTLSVLTGESSYATSKKKSEALFTSDNDIIVRPGLVVGAGGVFGQLIQKLQNWIAFPLFDGGEQEVAWIHIRDLCREVESLGRGPESGSFVLLDKKIMKFKDFCQHLSRDRRALLLMPVPLGVFVKIAQVGKQMGIKPLGFILDRLMGLRSSARVSQLLVPPLRVRWADSPLEEYADHGHV